MRCSLIALNVRFKVFLLEMELSLGSVGNIPILRQNGLESA